MKNLSQFTEVMRRVYLCKNDQERNKATKALKNFLEKISRDDLEQITRESKKGAELLALKTNPALVEGFIRSLDASTIGFREWVSSYSRSWAQLN